MIPVKVLARAKSRLATLAGPRRPELALAMAADTVAAAVACPAVGTVLAVTDDAVAAAELSALGAVVLADQPGAGLNPALSFGADHAARRWPGRGVAAMAADLPALRPGELAEALAAAELALAGPAPAGRPGAERTAAAQSGAMQSAPGPSGVGPSGVGPSGVGPSGVGPSGVGPSGVARSGAGRAVSGWHRAAFVADAAGTGTTVYLTGPGAAFRPQFGPGSRDRHGRDGALELDLPARSGLRRDVDTPADLRDAASLGLGPRTAALAAGLLRLAPR